jgi:uncharacterized protein
MKAPNHCKPDIEYPCQWQFRLIGENLAAMMEAIGKSADIALCRISEGNVSSGGRYLSLNLELTVQDDEERLRLYQDFSKHPAIRIVL